MNPTRAKALIQQWTAQQKIPPQQLNHAFELADISQIGRASCRERV